MSQEKLIQAVVIGVIVSVAAQFIIKKFMTPANSNAGLDGES